jgi:Domain of Unknown Function (DUF1206)
MDRRFGESRASKVGKPALTMARIVDSASVRTARGVGGGFVRSTAFEVLSRAGFVARGVIYGIIGLLAFEVAVSDTGTLTNQQGAIQTVADQPFGAFLLVLLAIGLGGYAIWRLFRAALGRGPEDADSTLERVAGLGSGLIYGGLCIVAVAILTGSSTSGPSSKPDRTTAGVFDWPAGRALVGIAGIILLLVAAYQLVKGIRQTFLDELKTGEMSVGMGLWVRWIGTIGHIARAIVFGLVGWFLLKAVYEFDAKEAVGLDGALTKILKAGYGAWLLGLVSLGLIAFSLYSITEARYRKI